MPTNHIVRKTLIQPSFRVDQVKGMFDVPNKTEILTEWDVCLPIDEKPWSIGAIIGASGSGKTTIATELFKNDYLHTSFDWHHANSILDEFPKEKTTKEIVEMLSSVGLSSPPHWLKPFCHLSNGQKFRVELARLLLSNHDRVLFDEFTSVVDRDVAKICCVALSKTIRRKKGPQLVAISCHFDIIDWLQPDWIFDVGSNCFEWRLPRRHPEISLKVHETNHTSWSLFRGHHYLDANLNRAARCFVATWNEKPVAFTSFLHFVHPIAINTKREHRSVVLPDFQGVGIGNKLSEFIAQKVINDGMRYISTTSHPAMIHHRNKSKLWRCHRFGHASGKHTKLTTMKTSGSRITAGFEYIG
jgi:ABC-type phosphate/phosphonate transport system ATPase subunit